MATARRLRLAVDPATGAVRLTLPPRASERRARLWAEEHRGWIETRLSGLPQARPIAPGASIPFRGEEIAIDWAASHPRAPRIENGRLRVGGPASAVPRRVLAWLRGEAARILEDETRRVADVAQVTVNRVSVNDPHTRWGSCSAGGDIRYSWRLILAPDFVWRSTVAHEVAHRLHMDHGAAFRATERRLYDGDVATARAWLRQHGAALHWIGRADPVC